MDRRMILVAHLSQLAGTWKTLALVPVILSQLLPVVCPPQEGGTKTEGGRWPSMHLNNPNLRLEKGTLLITGHARLMIALDSRTIVRVPWRHSLTQSYTWLIKVNLPVPQQSKSRAYRIAPPPGYDPDRAVALAKLLLGKKLPYIQCYCTERHWIRYIGYGEVWRHPLATWCPLNRELTDVKNPTEFFTLKEGTGRLRTIRELEPLPKEIDYDWFDDDTSDRSVTIHSDSRN